MTGKMTKYDKLEGLGDALQAECGGEWLSIKQMRRIVARTLGILTQSSFYEQLDTLEVVVGCLRHHKKEGVEILAVADGGPDDAAAMVEELQPGGGVGVAPVETEAVLSRLVVSP